MAQEYVAARVTDQKALEIALRGFERAGLSRDRVQVVSDLPLPEDMVRGRTKKSRLPYYTFTGLAVGLALGAFFAIGTLFLYPLQVGDQGYISPPALVIIYELTMLGIVLFTFGAYVYETRLSPSRLRLPELPVGPEDIFVVGILPPDLSPGRVRAALQQEGAQLYELKESA